MAFRPLESDTDSSRVPGSVAGSIADYRTDRGIAEATPGSGNTFGIEGIRILNADTFSDSTNAVVAKAGYVSPNGNGAIVDTTEVSGRAAIHFNFPNFDKAKRALRSRLRQRWLGKGHFSVHVKLHRRQPVPNPVFVYRMDEGNESFGSADSIVPVAYNRQLNPPTCQNQEATYTYDNSDGMPRYFVMAVSRESNAGNSIRSVLWSVGRADAPVTGDYHDVNTSSGSYSWSRGTYDKYVQKQLVDNYVAQ